MDSIFTRREIYGAMDAKGPVITGTKDPPAIMVAGHDVAL
jgi:hypothetical protein